MPIRIASTTIGVDSIIECTLIDYPDFSDLDSLINKTERATLKIIEEVQSYLSIH